MWFYEKLYEDIKLGLKGELIVKKRTPFQDLKIYHTSRFSKMLTLNGAIQTTEGDEFIYHEMLTHPVLFLHNHPQKVLIIGGGDGGALREVLQHKEVEEVSLVEIDKEVIELSQQHLSSICKNSFNNKKVKVFIEDGAEFVKKTSEKFDVTIIDSPDPIGVAKTLFSKKFYRQIFTILKEDGIMIRQSGSTFLQQKELRENYKTLTKIFPFVNVELVAIPTYIGGFFSFLVASKKIDPTKVDTNSLEKKFTLLKLKTKYYNPHIHKASFILPEYVRRLLK